MPKYKVYAEGVEELFEAKNMKEAIRFAREWGKEGWEPSDTTEWTDVYVEDEEGERELITVEINPTIPDCEAGEHKWESPYEILGGLKDNPGVWGNAGGVIINEVCLKCGCKKTTDTWAQRPDTGEQGLTSIAYEENWYVEDNF